MLSRLKRAPARLLHELRKEIAYAQPSKRPHRILFDHIPKCAGVMLGSYLQAHFPWRKTFHLDRKKPRVSVERFTRMPESRRHAFHFIRGHLAGYLLDEAHPDCLKITVLREPVDRIVSHYYFAKRLPSHYLHDWIHREGVDLKDYVVRAESSELRNHYTRHFSGLSREEVERDPDAALAKALERLHRYDLVGFQDDLDGFVEKLRSAANLRLPFPKQRVNVTKGRQSVDELDDDARGAIEQANALDLRVCEAIFRIKNLRE